MRDWTHRIDAVPAVGRVIDYKRKSDGSIVRATVALPSTWDDDRSGMGDDVRLSVSGTHLVPSREMTHWRYADR